MNGAYVNKADVLDAIQELETVILQQAELDHNVSDEMALYALRALAGVRISIKELTTVCMTDFEIKSVKSRK